MEHKVLDFNALLLEKLCVCYHIYMIYCKVHNKVDLA